MTVSDRLLQHLDTGEHLLFSSEKAELNLAPPGTRDSTPPIRGTLAVTDWRIYIMERQGFFSWGREWEAIFSSNQARQRIIETTAKNDELKPLAMKVSIISRKKWLKQHGYTLCVDILTDASLDRGMLSRKNLFLQVYHAYTDSDMRRSLENARKANAPLTDEAPGVSSLLAELQSSIGLTLVNSTCQLRIEQPLIMSAEAATTDFAAVGCQWLTPIIQNYKEKTDVTYEPILEIMQVKSQEMSAYIKEYENSSPV